MDKKEIKYYPYNQIGPLSNADTKAITNMLFCMQIMEINSNPDTIPMYRCVTVSEHFRRTERELFNKYFKDVFYFKDGTSKYRLEITDEFVKFVKDRIEKVGDLYNVHFK